MADTTFTLRDLVDLSLRNAGIVGVGQTPLAEDTKHAVQLLDMMIKQWRVDRWMVYALRTLGLTSTGAQSYSIGSGGDFVASPRPEVLESAYYRFLQPAGAQVDMPVTILRSREDYDLIALKTLLAPPTHVFLDTSWPTGAVLWWPVPNADLYGLYITFKITLEGVSLADLSTDMALSWPGEYYSALVDVLSVRLREFYKLSPREMLVRAAKKSVQTIQAANLQLAELELPSTFVAPRGVGYNIYSDR